MEKKQYPIGKSTVVWQPHLCSHSAKCVKGLPQVFDPRKRPWINVAGADEETISRQVAQCPSGALSLLKTDAE